MSEDNGRPQRDVILIGGSAGGIDALLKIVPVLPSDFPCAILAVIHTSPESPSLLPRVLERAGALSASHPREGERIEPGHIYIAPPDHHLVIGEGGVLGVRKGPRENGHRPAIDPLFRSAATHGYGPRTIAVVLSGFLDDGSAGLYAIRSRGGVAVIQDPADALASDMPSNALQYAGADYILPASEIGAKLVELAGQIPKVVAMSKKKKESGSRRAQPVRDELAPNERVTSPEESVLGTPSVFACPECHGVLWEIKEGGSVRYRCRVGHAYSQATLSDELSRAGETALWAAMRALDEKAAMSRRMADAASGPQRWAARLREQADTYSRHASMLRKMILGEPQEPRREREEMLLRENEKPA